MYILEFQQILRRDDEEKYIFCKYFFFVYIFIFLNLISVMSHPVPFYWWLMFGYEGFVHVLFVFAIFFSEWYMLLGHCLVKFQPERC